MFKLLFVINYTIARNLTFPKYVNNIMNQKCALFSTLTSDSCLRNVIYASMMASWCNTRYHALIINFEFRLGNLMRVASMRISILVPYATK